MKSARWLSWAGGILIPVAAALFLFWAVHARATHVAYASSVGSEEIHEDATSPSGFIGGVRRLIVPGHNEASYRWIIQTEQMLSTHVWRIRHVDYDNAPTGHAVSATSPYRWWLGLVAQVDHHATGHAVGASVERAAVEADPVFALIFFVFAVLWISWRFGVLAGALVALGLAGLFPFAGNFLGGLPESSAWSQAIACLSVLILLPGARSSSPERDTARAIAGGVVGALGLWFNVAFQFPVVIAIGAGAVVSALVRSRGPSDQPLDRASAFPWRAWALAGAVSTILAYFGEFAPDYLAGWELRAVHPLYALAWVGLGELAHAANVYSATTTRRLTVANIIWILVGLAALASLPIGMYKLHSHGFLAADSASTRLTKLSESAIAANSWAWLVHQGITREIVVVTLPLLFIFVGIWILSRLPRVGISRERLLLALVPALVVSGFALWRLAWWTMADAMLLALVVAISASLTEAATSITRVRTWGVLAAIILGVGAFELAPLARAGGTSSVSDAEERELLERDLAYSLVKQSGGAEVLVLAPITDGSALCYYGGIRALGTLDPDNRDGVVAAVRICSATSGQEAQELVLRRGVTHFIIPSWDSQLDDFARLGIGQVDGSFISTLDHWALPPWLRPIAYQLPVNAQKQGLSVTELAVVDEQDDSVLYARLAEYYIEMNRTDLLPPMIPALRKFPGNPGCLAALADVELTLGDEAEAENTIRSLLIRLSSGADRSLPWDRRVSLAVILARTKHFDLAQAQARRCFQEMNEARLRSLSVGSLYHLMVLGRAFHLEPSKPKLTQLALDLLPPEARTRLTTH